MPKPANAALVIHARQREKERDGEKQGEKELGKRSKQREEFNAVCFDNGKKRLSTRIVQRIFNQKTKHTHTKTETVDIYRGNTYGVGRYHIYLCLQSAPVILLLLEMVIPLYKLFKQSLARNCSNSPSKA